MRRVFRFLTLILVFTISATQITISPTLGSLNRLIGVLVLIVWLLDIVKRRGVRRLVPLHIIAVLFLGWAVFSLVWTVSAAATLDTLLRYAQSIGLTFFVWDLCRTKDDLRDVMQAYVLGAFVLVVNVFLAYIAQRTYSFGGLRFSPPGFDPNDAAVVMSLAIPMAWRLMTRYTNSKRWWRVINGVYPFVAIIAVIMTGSRGGALAALPALLYVMYTFPRIGIWRRILFISLFLGALFVASNLDLSFAMGRFLDILGSAETDRLAGRLDIWQAGWETFRQYPLLGVGAGAFRIGVTSYSRAGAVAHNVHLEILASLGIPGYLLFLGVFINAIRGALRQVRQGVLVYLVILAVWFVGSLSLTWDYAPHTWLVFVICVSAGAIKADSVVATVAVRGKWGLLSQIRTPSTREKAPVAARVGTSKPSTHSVIRSQADELW